jgi:hypothetical protein
MRPFVGGRRCGGSITIVNAARLRWERYGWLPAWPPVLAQARRAMYGWEVAELRMRYGTSRVGLLTNFNVALPKQGIKRLLDPARRRSS